MSTLTADQIYQEALEAGWTGTAAHTITAIALAESGGNPNAHNGKAPDNSYGLTQINMIGNLGAPRRSEYGITSNNALLDPVTNLKAALHVYNDAGGSFKPWSTYTSGSYKNNLGVANAATGGTSLTAGIDAARAAGDKINSNPNAGITKDLASIPGAGAVGDAIGALPANPLSVVTDAWGVVSSKSFWVRVSFILGGLIILLIGVSQLTKGGTLSEPTPASPIAPNNRPSVASRAARVAEE